VLVTRQHERYPLNAILRKDGLSSFSAINFLGDRLSGLLDGVAVAPF
jgi:hypothetical protein